MGNAAELSQIQIPFVAFRVQSLFANPRQQRIILLNSLPTTCNLPVTFRSQTVDRQSYFRIRWIRHMIERLRFLRIMSDEEWSVKLHGQQLLLLISKIVAPFYPRLFFSDHLERLVVCDSLKRRFHFFQIL